MTALRVTAIMKTDIVDSTPRFRSLGEADLSALLVGHREFVSRLATVQGGRIFKAGGDGFWISFPSVTAAGLAALAMQEELRRSQSGRGDDRLTMRVVIAVGDVLDDEQGDLIGDALALADRIEAITPPDEIYISAAARLVVNQAEIRTSLVDAFPLKGFLEPVAVYRIEQTHHTQWIKGQYIVVADLGSFSKFMSPPQAATIERVLERLLELVGQVCREFGGTIRFNVGDAYCLTYSDADRALAAAERLAEGWHLFNRSENLDCPVTVALHKGDLYLYRSYIYGADLMATSAVMTAGKRLAGNDTAIFVTGQVCRELSETSWRGRLRRVDLGTGQSRRLAEVEVFLLENLEWSSRS
jgi:class 3 adenylate cyclase